MDRLIQREWTNNAILFTQRRPIVAKTKGLLVGCHKICFPKNEALPLSEELIKREKTSGEVTFI
jgi:hypothetical protein